jgi:hypothetical protein
MNYNPYALVPLLINGKPIDGRPFEFDSTVVNQKTMKNAFGNYVKPSKVVSVCPDCGQGLQISLRLGDPPFQPVAYLCHYCRPAPPPLIDPFVNPLVSGRVPIAELDPLLHNPDKPLPMASKGSVADRFEKPVVALPVAPATIEGDLAPNIPSPDPNKKKTQKTPEPPRSALLEKADGIDEEKDDFDDSEMVDDDE